MAKQLTLPFESIDAMFRRLREIRSEEESLWLAIWEKQNECSHDWADFRYEPIPPSEYVAALNDPHDYWGTGWSVPTDTPRWRRTCKVCRQTRDYDEKQYNEVRSKQVE
jgi:hypothetical protein